jgi:hypothetical protein
MSVIRVGSTGKYADGWESIFGGATASGRRLTAAKKSGGVPRKATKAARSKPAADKKSGAKPAGKAVKKGGRKSSGRPRR